MSPALAFNARPVTHSRRRRQPSRGLAAMIAAEAGTLAVVSSLHLSGAIAGGTEPYDPGSAGVAEAVICVVLAAGAIALLVGHARGRKIALCAVGFAIVGFIIGLTFTIQGGTAFDVAYHAVMLPLLIATAWWARRDPATG